MKKRSIILIVSVISGVSFFSVGCSTLRFAPDEAQKQNSYLHYRTVHAAAVQAAQEDTSEVLKQLTGKAVHQSEAIMAYYGFPEKLQSAETVEQILDPGLDVITQQALEAGLSRPDPWDVADYLMELGLGLAGIVGGVYGTRITGALRLAKEKSQALREVIAGNELFKKTNPELSETFKQAQQQQSGSTRQLVAGMK